MCFNSTIHLVEDNINVSSTQMCFQFSQYATVPSTVNLQNVGPTNPVQITTQGLNNFMVGLGALACTNASSSTSHVQWTLNPILMSGFVQGIASASFQFSATPYGVDTVNTSAIRSAGGNNGYPVNQQECSLRGGIGMSQALSICNVVSPPPPHPPPPPTPPSPSPPPPSPPMPQCITGPMTSAPSQTGHVMQY